jgi:uncharacterized membrane protein YdbT with pleckstrin-like domain
MAKTNKEILDEMDTKSAREHEEWIRKVTKHEIKWMAIRFLIGVANGIFCGGIVALLTIILINTYVEIAKILGATNWLLVSVLVVGLLCIAKLMILYFGSKFQLINYDAKTPLFIDKVDKKTEAKDE